MEISPEDVEAANRRAQEASSAFPVAVAVRYDRRISRIVITLSSGLDLAFSPHDAQGLEHARPADLQDAQLSPSGMGVHFPRLDADLYIPALLEGFLGSRKWMAAEMGKRGGKSVSAAKSTAARENGKLGGRPRKAKVA
jgi:hypothetical protein